MSSPSKIKKTEPLQKTGKNLETKPDLLASSQPVLSSESLKNQPVAKTKEPEPKQENHEKKTENFEKQEETKKADMVSEVKSLSKTSSPIPSKKPSTQESELLSTSMLAKSKSPSKNRIQLKTVKEQESPSRSLKTQLTSKITPEEIDKKVRSRRRVLEILEEQTSSVNEESFLQIQSRDMLIEELTKELIEIKSAVKLKKLENEDVIILKNLKQRVADLEKEKLVLAQEYEDLAEMKKIDQINLTDERNEYDKIIESMNEEISLLRTQLKSKEEENLSMLDDIKKLAEITKQFKNANSDLHGKIEKLNNDLEEIKIKYLEAEIRAASLTELEASLNDYIRLHRDSEKNKEAYNENIKNLTLAYEDLEAFLNFVASQVEQTESAESEEEKSSILKEIKKGIQKKSFIKHKKKEKTDKNLKFVEMSEKLEKCERELRTSEHERKPLIDEINGLKELIKVIKKEHQDACSSLNVSMKTLQDRSDSLSAEVQVLRLEVSRKETKCADLSLKIINLENLQTKNEEKTRKILEVKNLFEKENNELKEKIRISANSLEEKKIELKKLASANLTLSAKVQAFHEEYWKKDSALLKQKKVIIKLEKKISDLNKAKIEMPKSDETSEKLLKEIFERDRKIEVLKDMLKSKKKQKNREVSFDASLELYPEKYEKNEQDLINSLVAKIINKFFAVCMVNKNNPESPPDIPRLIKKLRQDLKMYTVFNTKDLQLSVPKLQQALIECKSHLNLEEVLIVISKVAYAL